MPPRTPSPIGTHVPSGGGLVRAVLPYVRDVGAEALQVFVSNPRAWARSPGDPGTDETFRAACVSARLPVFVHAPYLINFGSPSAVTLSRSVEAVRHSISRGARLGARGVVVHAGSAVEGTRREDALDSVREHLLPILDGLADTDPDVLVEPMAGGGASLASRVADIEPYLARLDDHPRLRVCLDTCHLIAAGHDLAAPGGMRSMLSELVRTIGRGRLALVHANDSKDPVGSGRDRHQSVGAGTIGAESFAELFRHPATRGVPVVVETPGDADGHRRDIALLKELRGR